jgi:hypothetical protein
MKLEGYRGAGWLLLNDTPLATLPADQTSGTWLVSDRLLPRNTLSVVLQFDPAADDRPGGLFGLVALEIVAVMTASTGST